jgi:GMP synthase-like glutamine amidotransferase
MRALVIVHDPGSEGGLVGDRLAERGYDVVEVPVVVDSDDPTGSTDAFGAPTDHDLIVPMGSTFSLTDTDRISSWIHDELDFLRDADAAGVPVFGICFGGQALAAAHGGCVVRSDAPQVGWHPLSPFDGSPQLSGPWMQWHYDRFEPPSDADVLAVDHVGVQAFTLRRNLGVQFHPEVTRPHLQRWVDLGAVHELEQLGVDADALLDQTERLHDDVAVRTRALVDWFIDDVATRRV